MLGLVTFAILCLLAIQPKNSLCHCQTSLTELTVFPNLLYISFSQLNEARLMAEDRALEEKYPWSLPLRLTHFTEFNPRFVSPNLLGKVCPNLTHLCLSAPLGISAGGVTMPHLARCNEVRIKPCFYNY